MVRNPQRATAATRTCNLTNFILHKKPNLMVATMRVERDRDSNDMNLRGVQVDTVRYLARTISRQKTTFL